MNVQKVREQFPITSSCVFMDVANHSPPSTPVQDAVRAYLLDWDKLARRGDERVEEACETFAKLVGASKDEIACQPNTSAGLSTVAETIEFRRGNNVIVNDLENPANIYPWLTQGSRGVKLKTIKGRGGAVRIEDVEKTITDRTRVVAISHVEWMTGARHDLKALSSLVHEHGAYLVVDGIQAAGAMKVDVKRDNVDFYACGSYKWLLGESGAGFLYVRKELLSLEPRIMGYRAMLEASLDKPKLKPTAKRFELGEPAYMSFVSTDAGMKLILQLGPEEIEAHVLRLTGLLMEGLLRAGVRVASPQGKDMRSGIVSFQTGDDRTLHKDLLANGFQVALRRIGIRVSPDFYNTEEEVGQLVSRIEASLHGPRH